MEKRLLDQSPAVMNPGDLIHSFNFGSGRTDHISYWTVRMRSQPTQKKQQRGAQDQADEQAAVLLHRRRPEARRAVLLRGGVQVDLAASLSVLGRLQSESAVPLASHLQMEETECLTLAGKGI